MSRKNDNDIKAPDGFLLGGLRKVRKDGTILFQRGYWQAPLDWAGQKVWVHENYEVLNTGGAEISLEVAHPGLHIYEAKGMRPPHTVICERTAKPDARRGYRNPSAIAWANRVKDE